jgi:Zn-dependent protease with chaperone function
MFMPDSAALGHYFREISGLGHIQNRDTLIMSVAATLAGTLSILADAAIWGLMLGGRSSEHDDERVIRLDCWAFLWPQSRLP